jgi:LPXTG-site transpeptidase (sortase) family protein
VTSQTGRNLTSWVLVAAGLALVLGGLYWWQHQTPHRVEAGSQDPLSITSGGTLAPLPEARPGHWRPGAPTHIVIPALSVDVPVLPIRTEGNTLTPPSDPQELGWWSGGAAPGARRGSALITGHTVHTGGGALDHLADLRTGDPVAVRVRGSAKPLRYLVTRVHTYGKGQLARQVKKVFSQSVPGRLVLITCADWNGVEYESNTVVTAAPAWRVSSR